MQTPRTAAEFREESRSLALTAERCHPDDVEGFYRAAGRCSRIANLLDRGLSLDDAAERVTRSR